MLNLKLHQLQQLLWADRWKINKRELKPQRELTYEACCDSILSLLQWPFCGLYLKGNRMQEKKYGLFTAITMITGIVIGSGIFFKSDDVLLYAEGNMLLGVLVFLIAAVSIIFGSLAISSLASRSDKPGGIISYAEEFIGANCAGSLGLFQVCLYLAPLIAVVAWVTGLYICQLFGLEATHETSTLIGFGVLCVVYLMNVLSSTFGGFFQNAAMIIKLLPLIAIAILGLIYGEAAATVKQDVETIHQTLASTSILAAFAPIAFSYDGWIVTTSICHEIKNSKRNLPLAMIFSPIIILLCYIMYFVGITSLLGAELIMEYGNESVFFAATQLFGPMGAKLILIFVVISVLGTLNGLVLAFIQMPYSLALRNMIPYSTSLKKQSVKLGGMPVNSAILGFFLSLLWMILNYLMQKANIPGDVSEVPICFSYLSFISLYYAVIRLARKKEIKSKTMGYVVPGIAIIGSVVIFTGSITHPLFWIYVIVSILVLAVGYFYSKNNAIEIDTL